MGLIFLGDLGSPGGEAIGWARVERPELFSSDMAKLRLFDRAHLTYDWPGVLAAVGKYKGVVEQCIKACSEGQGGNRVKIILIC